MTDLITLQRDLESLKASFRSGVQTASYDGKNVVFRDSAQMMAAIASIENEIAALAGTPPVRSFRIFSSKGW